MTTDPRIAVLSALSSPGWHPIPEAHGMPWDEAEQLLAAYDASRAAVSAVAPATDRAAAPVDWIDGHPTLEAIAAAVWERCGRSDSGMCVEDDPRNIAVAALAAVLPASVDRAAVLREAAAECDKAGGVYGSRGANDAAGAAFALMETFLRKANEAEYVATPCDFAACEPGGEPCSTHERLMAHAEGDHELCAPDCGIVEAQQPKETRP